MPPSENHCLWLTAEAAGGGGERERGGETEQQRGAIIAALCSSQDGVASLGAGTDPDARAGDPGPSETSQDLACAAC